MSAQYEGATLIMMIRGFNILGVFSMLTEPDENDWKVKHNSGGIGNSVYGARVTEALCGTSETERKWT